VATNPDSLPPVSEEGKEVTAYLVQYKKDKTGAVSAMATNMVPRMIKEGSEKMGSALPAYELQRLLEMTGVGASFLSSLAWLIIGVSGFSVFISLYNSLKERRYELALMRVMGASKGKIFALLILEGLLLSGLGVVFGLFMSHLGMSLLAGSLEKAYQYEFSGLIFLMGELWLGLGMLGLGFLAALFPALSAYKADISKQLQ
jgi:putative ABC transport system permease protein